MEPGYYSNTAVKDLLAVKEGEILYLKQKVNELEQLLIRHQIQLPKSK